VSAFCKIAMPPPQSTAATEMASKSWTSGKNRANASLVSSHASRHAAFCVSNTRSFSASRPKSFTTSTPENVSCMIPVRRATRSRVARKPRRALRRNATLARITNGSTAYARSESFQSIQKSTTVMPTIVTMSATIESRPAVSKSFSVSTSDVSRVTVRPTGVRSK